MLSSLNIKNYALIRDLKFTPKHGLNTITGETGAGKSILLGALGLITGNRADTHVLLDKTTKCVVEGHFKIQNYQLSHIFESLDIDYQDTTIIRREITPAGKSRAFVNDTPVTLDALKKLGARLIDVHSQNETIKLNTQNYQSRILDFLTDSHTARESFKKQFNLLKNLEKQLAQIQETAQKEKSELDYNSFLLNELNEIEFEGLDADKLESEVKAIENFSDIKEALAELNQAFESSEYSLIQLISEALQSSKNLSKLSPQYQKIEERINSLYYEITDLSKEITNEDGHLEIDEENITQKIELYNKLQALLKKHQAADAAQLAQIKYDLEDKIAKASSIDESILQLQKKIGLETKKAVDLAQELHQSRSHQNQQINQKIASVCSELGMPETVFEIGFEKLPELKLNGLYDIKFLFSSNKGVKPEEISKVASGGEFSRLMFAIKSLLATKTHLPTIIFDEIDTGISGEIALKMGRIMQEMSKDHQLICITHLPQIAAKGAHHFYVFKDNSGSTTESNIRELIKQERTLKIAEMIGGDQPGEMAIKSAQELLLG